MIGATMRVPGQGIGHSRLVREVVGAVGKQGWERILALNRFEEGFQGDGKKGVGGALGNHFIVVTDQDDEDFRTVRGSEVQTAGADGNLPLARRAARA